VATAADGTVLQDPPLVTWPPPLAGETPAEEEDDPAELVPDCPEEDVWPPVRSLGRCGSDGDRCANLAPAMTAAAAASSPARQVIFLTRRKPSSLARRAFGC
jgi:hypothetical protein